MKYFFIVVLVLITSCCSFESMYGETGRQLDIAYKNSNGKKLYCLGECLLYNEPNPYPCNQYPMRYRVNVENEYIENYEGCAIVDDVWRTAIKKEAKCFSGIEYGTEDNIASAKSYVTVVGADMGIHQSPREKGYSAECLAQVMHIELDNTDKPAALGYLKVEVETPITKENILRMRTLKKKNIKYISISDVNRNSFGGWSSLEEAEKFADTRAEKIKKIMNTKKQEMEMAEKKHQQISKKAGFPWCSSNYTFWSQNNCIFKVADVLSVVQQTSEGTLATFMMGMGINRIFLIEKNIIDSTRADGDIITGGIFAISGTYTYTAVFGNSKTVHRLKRIQ